ncbi:MAG: succinate dehydrogenase/fumarate reductase flavoprotein subunit [Aigarchaeota archaeon]|nr:succinate dehydrogenase/fumarate reductase flavoprotein subunit [Aigarchaeota archaeon]MDW8092626.1 succinate dehydrogenase/fumarate reductase flavoprotein subunit [Nitrososphaerota archaeon]
MVEKITHDVVVIGSGLAGLRAAIEAARVGNSKLSIAVVSKTQAMRSHSVSAEGGTAAVLYPEEGDSIESHIYDTIKGSDFLADQDAVELFVNMCPVEVLLLDHWGMPWSRRPDGKIAQRYFGGMSYPRTCYAEDKVGFFEMSTLYDTCLRFDQIEFYHEYYVTSLLTNDGKFAGVTAVNLSEGDLVAFEAKAGVIATGGAGRLYNLASFGHSSTPDGLYVAFRANIPLKDMEFVQFHPTGLVPSGILITEAARGEGGILRNNKGERFMERYASKSKELAPRDIVSRSIMKEIYEGRGFKDEHGNEYVELDLTVIEPEKVKTRLSGIREICMKFIGKDPVNEPIPIRPIAHYYMGGIDTDIDGATSLPGLWSAGEVACVSINGANRLGSNSTSECLVWGRITGEKAARYALSSSSNSIDKSKVAEEEKRVFDRLLGPRPRTSPYDVKRKVQSIMENHFYVYRDGESMLEGLKKLRDLKNTLELGVEDKSRKYNTNLMNVFEIEAMVHVAETIAISAVNRSESRGAHYRVDYPKRDDVNWLKHTLVYKTVDGPEIGYKNVVITRFQSVERTY